MILLILCLGFIHFVLADFEAAEAYTGGPIRATVGWYDAKERKVYYRLDYLDDSGRKSETYCFALDDSNASRPVRSKLHAYGSPSNVTFLESDKRLEPLEILPNFELTLQVNADSVGSDAQWDLPVYAITARISTSGAERVVEMTGHCQPSIRVRGVYRVPGRSERVVVLSYIGRAYGCEEVEQPLLLQP